ncbi:uncharacterized protein LOC133712894 isoform X2 [Rosa rugosa]|uniref:uncharacterized protein LOC133712894 isoform X2 n=1 Tax=Rosa rugosa TaxID=74645 RepID=UPI002B416C17|nr:uncharacterized protein LOC133712894 isoform X2 [Rosa rugosa]
MASHTVALFFVFFIINLASLQVFAGVVLEEGYTVTTVIDGHKLDINPYSVLPRPGSSDLIVLDSSGSAFYTVSLPPSKSQDSVVKRLSGAGGEGYTDGESGTALFRKPRAFAVNQKGTVFVADRSNNVIRKISASGVSTIAGGYSLKPGHEDGPAQNATFSSDFDLAFDAGKCVLLVSDRGNQLVRLISLKPEDCAGSSPPSALGSVPRWIIGLGSCFVGILVGLVVPYIRRYTGGQQPARLQRDMEAMPNEIGESSTDYFLRQEKRNC